MTITSIESINRTCIVCHKKHEIKATAEQIFKFRDTGDVQASFPNATLDEKELLISGLCGTCFDNIFEGEE